MPPATPSPPTRLAALDGIRGLAVLMVLFGHLSNLGINPIPFTNFTGIGKIGVYLFFVLSAFLLTDQFLRKDASAFRSARFWANYFLRRFLRIFPLFGFVLVASWLTTRYLDIDLGGHGIPFRIYTDELMEHLTLQQGKSVLWSVPVEFKYYFLLPVVALTLRALLGRHVALSVGAATFAVVAATYLWPPAEARGNSVQLGDYLAVFLLGSLAAAVHRSILDSEPRPKRFHLAAECIGAACLAGGIITTPALYGLLTGEHVPYNYFHRGVVLYGILWSGFVLGTLHGSGQLRRILSWRVLRYAGFVSFSIYLWHLSILLAVQAWLPLPPAAQGLVALIGTISLASASYAAIEHPLLRFRLNVAPSPPLTQHPGLGTEAGATRPDRSE